MLGLMPNGLYISHGGQSGGRGLSPKIWDRLMGGASSPAGDSPYYGLFDDFCGFGIGTAVAANVGYYVSQSGAWKSYEDTGGTIARIATAVGGVVTLTVDADDNQENWLASGDATSVLGVISDTAGSDKPLLFECRFKTSAVVGNLFVGLTEEGLAAADTITDAGAMADKDLIGFYALEGAPTSLIFGYKKAGQTIQNVATVKTIAADTWYKVGFVYDPTEVASKRIKIFVDNVEQSTYVTATNIAAATFPDGEELNITLGHKNVTDITALSIDWVGFAQQG